MNSTVERQTVDAQRGLRRVAFIVSLVVALLCVWLVPPRLYFQFDRFAGGLPQQFLTFDPDRYLAGIPQRGIGEVVLICAVKFLVAFALVWIAYFIGAFIYRGFRPTKT